MTLTHAAFRSAAGVPATNTIERIDQWSAKSCVGTAEADAWSGAFYYLQLIRLRHQWQQIARGEAADNHVNPDQLDDLERRTLRESLRLAKSLQTRLALDYHL